MIGIYPFSLIILTYISIIILTCLLVNVLNFYDGADLNLCLLILISGLILFFSDNFSNENFKNLGSILISFSLGFGIMNSRPKKIYLGDAGSFAIATIMIFIFIFSIFENRYFPEEFLCLLALPIFDVLYVLLIRIIKKHNLLSRNYLHLYQRLQIKYGYFYYLIPLIINFISTSIAFKALIKLSGNYVLSIFSICFIITPAVYLLIRSIYVETEYFFGDGT